jgi:hypothetical protein
MVLMAHFDVMLACSLRPVWLPSERLASLSMAETGTDIHSASGVSAAREY